MAAVAVALAWVLLVPACATRSPALLTADQAAVAGLESLQRGEGTRAVQLLERARRQGKSGEEIERGIAAGHVMAGDADRAIRTLERALADKPKSAELWHLLGSLELQTGDATNGVLALERAVRLSGRWDFVRDLAEAYLGRGDRGRALATLQRAWRAAPEGVLRAQVAVQLGDLLTVWGGDGDALVWYRRAAADDPANEGARRGLGGLGPAPAQP